MSSADDFEAWSREWYEQEKAHEQAEAEREAGAQAAVQEFLGRVCDSCPLRRYIDPGAAEPIMIGYDRLRLRDQAGRVVEVKFDRGHTVDGVAEECRGSRSRFLLRPVCQGHMAFRRISQRELQEEEADREALRRNHALYRYTSSEPPAYRRS